MGTRRCGEGPSQMKNRFTSEGPASPSAPLFPAFLCLDFLPFSCAFSDLCGTRCPCTLPLTPGTIVIYHPLGLQGLSYVAPCSQRATRPSLLPTALLWALNRSFISQEALQRTHYFFETQDETGSVRISVALSFYAITLNPLCS